MFTAMWATWRTAVPVCLLHRIENAGVPRQDVKVSPGEAAVNVQEVVDIVQGVDGGYPVLRAGRAHVGPHSSVDAAVADAGRETV